MWVLELQHKAHSQNPHRQHQIVEIYGNIRDKTFLELTTILKTKKKKTKLKKKFSKLFSEERCDGKWLKDEPIYSSIENTILLSI